MSPELVEKTDVNELVYELSPLKSIVNSLPDRCILEEVTDSKDIASIYFGLRNSSFLIDLRPNEIKTIQVYSIVIYEDDYTQSFFIGCTVNSALYQFKTVTNGFGKIDEVLIEQYRDGTYRTVSCTECIESGEFEMAMVLKDILTKEITE